MFKRVGNSAGAAPIGAGNRSRRQVLTVAGLGATALLAGCGTAANAGPASGGGSSKSDRFVLVGLLVADPFWTDIKKGAQDAADMLGVTFEFTGPQAFDTEGQVSAANTIIASKPKGMILPAFSPKAMPPVIDAAVAAGIPVVTIDSDAPDSKRAVFIGTDHVDLGRVMGQELVKHTGGTAKIGVATVAGQANLDQRIAGMKQVFDAHPGMQIVATVDNKGSADTCATVVAAMLQAHPEITAVANMNAASAGVAAALRETNRLGKVVAVTSDINEPVAAAIKSGAIKSTMVQRTYAEGYFGIMNLVMLARPTKFMANQASHNVTTLPPIFTTGTIVVNSDNVAAYL